MKSALRRPGSRTQRQPDRDNEPGARRWWPVLTPLAVLAVGSSLLWPAGRHQWALSLFRQSARYTVLSFSRESVLPSTAVLNQPVPVSFTIGNHEGRAENYRYILAAGDGERLHILRESARTIAAGATWMVSAVVRPRCAVSPCRIQVSLPGHPETIDFLLTIKDRGA